MNAFEREIIGRLYSAQSSIPAPLDGGSVQGTITGFAGYSRDMVAFQRLSKNILYEMASPNPDLTHKERKELIEEYMREVEKFIKLRVSDNWSISGAGRI
ncbi:hypothetical protein [Vibrio harveyi]|uniref:hypothetical protein n=1 Tax=Vibrio harveyi TaxID=669 RepID=UPI00217EC103|nr:hypothetical protein [Vibrio harveyi]